MMLDRRTFLTASAAALVIARPAAAAPLTLDRIEAYLDGLSTVTARFSQINDDGSRSSGRFMMRRPGRMRFEYDAPDESLVIAGRGSVAIFDARSNEPPQRFQLANTPLKILLFDDIDLGRERMLVAHQYDDTYTYLTLQDPEHPEYGSLRVVFADPPALTGWVVTDGSGARTTVTLSGLQTGMRLPGDLFDLDAALAERGLD